MDTSQTAKKLAAVKRRMALDPEAKASHSEVKVKTEEDTEAASSPQNGYCQYQNNDSCAESRIKRKEQIADLEKASLQRLKHLIEKDGNTSPEYKPWLEHADEIIALGQLPRIPIGLLGYTGSGKSSLINALVDEETLLPTNGMRASTSVVVELSYNQSDDPTKAYAACVEFCSPDEWAAEIRILREDIECRPEGENLSASSTSDAGVALAKFKAVYPGIPTDKLLRMTEEEVIQDTNLSDILGKSKTIYTANAKEFSKAITQYIDSANKTSKSGKFEYWPLVRLVKVYVKASLLKDGLVLVDLPGLGDSNSGRAAVAESYIKHLKSVWVIADINRAVDDKVAQDLLGATFKRQLLLNGNYHERFVTFVMTRIDNLNTDEVISNLNLHNTSLRSATEKEAQLEVELEEALEQVDTIDAEYDTASSSTGSKRKFANMNDIDRRDKIRLQGKINRLRSKIAASKLSMRVKCIGERNKYTQDRMEADFQYGMVSLVQELLDAGDDNAGSFFDKISASSQGNGLKTFCVSAKAYQKARGRFKRDPEIQGFSNISDTGIPSLAEFAKQCTLAYREVAVDTFHTEMTLWKSAVKTWAEQDFKDATLTEVQRDRLITQLNQYYGTLKASEKRARTNMAGNVTRYMRSKLASQMASAIVAGSEKATGVAETKIKSNIPSGTWKAILRREGEAYLTSKSGPYHWNEDLVNSYMDHFLAEWTEFFQEKLRIYHGKYATIMRLALDGFQATFGAFVSDTCGAYPPIQHILDQIYLQKNRIMRIVLDALNARKEKAADAPRILRNSIKRHMVPFYREGRQQSGKGMLVRIKVGFQKHVNQNSHEMYTEASEAILDELREMHRALLPDTSEKVQKILSQLVKTLQETIHHAVIDEAALEEVDSAKSVLRHRIIREFQDLEAKCSQRTIKEDTDSQTNSSFDLLDIFDANIEDESIDFEDDDITILDGDPFKF
ncbi:hypothetical protein BKA64DRAFT_422019 [Cadophora sp. MPI-SDFR-AT-0126]|nr:hypothetical protein BKA64DRAFT_422019 [Leotiomycetes sp. MPI-SDFR-AT-0126]